MWNLTKSLYKRTVASYCIIKKLEQKIQGLEEKLSNTINYQYRYYEDTYRLRGELEELQKKLDRANETLVLLTSVLPENILAERLSHLQKEEKDNENN